MAYKITYEPLHRIRGVEPKTVIVETATEACKLAERPVRSDERVTVNDGAISLSHLEQLADEEASGLNA